MRGTGLKENQRGKESKLGQMEESMRDNSMEVNPVGLEPRLLLKELKQRVIGLEESSSRESHRKEYLRSKWRSLLTPRNFTKK